MTPSKCLKNVICNDNLCLIYLNDRVNELSIIISKDITRLETIEFFLDVAICAIFRTGQQGATHVVLVPLMVLVNTKRYNGHTLHSTGCN